MMAECRDCRLWMQDAVVLASPLGIHSIELNMCVAGYMTWPEDGACSQFIEGDQSEDDTDEENKLRALWYDIRSAIEDEEDE